MMPHKTFGNKGFFVCALPEIKIIDNNVNSNISFEKRGMIIEVFFGNKLKMNLSNIIHSYYQLFVLFQ